MPQCPLFPRKRTSPKAVVMSALCHVWTAPSWQGKSARLQPWSVQPCVRSVCAVHMTAGHNALRGSGPGQKAAFEDACTALTISSVPVLRAAVSIDLRYVPPLAPAFAVSGLNNIEARLTEGAISRNRSSHLPPIVSVVKAGAVKAADFNVFHWLGLDRKICCLPSRNRDQTGRGAEQEAFQHLHLEPLQLLSRVSGFRLWRKSRPARGKRDVAAMKRKMSQLMLVRVLGRVPPRATVVSISTACNSSRPQKWGVPLISGLCCFAVTTLERE